MPARDSRASAASPFCGHVVSETGRQPVTLMTPTTTAMQKRACARELDAHTEFLSDAYIDEPTHTHTPAFVYNDFMAYACVLRLRLVKCDYIIAGARVCCVC